jgi:hypothetical protein
MPGRPLIEIYHNDCDDWCRQFPFPAAVCSHRDMYSDAVAQARKVYGLYHAADKLVLDVPWDDFRLSSTAQDRIVQ